MTVVKAPAAGTGRKMKHWFARGLLAGMPPSAFYLCNSGSGMPSIASAAYNLMLPPCFCHTVMAG